MTGTHSNIAEGTKIIAGPPMLAKIAGTVSTLVAAGSVLAWPDPYAISTTIVAGLIAWRLFQLSLRIEGNDVVIRNLFGTTRIRRQDAQPVRSISDLRTRTPWGGQILPKGSVPKMADDNMNTHTKLIRIADATDPTVTTHTDCSLGLLPDSQDALFAKLETALTC